MSLIIASNAVTAKLVDAPHGVKLLVQEILSYRVDGAEHMPAFTASAWNGRSSFFQFKAGTFPAGFVNRVYAGLVKAGYKVRLVSKPSPAPLGPLDPVVDSFPIDPRYDYQPEVVRSLIRHSQIIAQVATGGGKSRIAKLAFARLGRRTLFLTTRSILMYQMKDQVERDLKQPVGVIGDGEFGYIDKVDGRKKLGMFNVGMVQTIAEWIKEPDLETSEFEQARQVKRQGIIRTILEKFEFVILEEAHESSGNSYYEIMRACKNAHYRLALTATPFMKDSEEANMRLMASSGPVAIRVSEKTLIDRGILARPVFKFVGLRDRWPAYKEWVVDKKGEGRWVTHKLFKSTPWQKAYEVGVVNNRERNEAIFFEAQRAARHGLSVMILTIHKKHGHLLNAMFKERGARVRYIAGENDQAERSSALDALKSRSIDILIGSNNLDVGVDVPAVGMIILAGAGKAEVALRQRIGRGLREKKSGPNVAFIVDFDDPVNNHLRGHARNRRTIIESTDGFKQGIVTSDFDFSREGFRISA